MHRLALLVPWLFLSTGPAAPVSGEGGQVVLPDGSAIEDRDYRFRLERPGERWELLSEERVRGVLPDAVVGARLLPEGIFGAVVVERTAPGVVLETFREAVLESLPAKSKVRLLDEETTLAGEPALRTVVKADMEGGISFLRHTVVARGEYVYQLSSWTTARTTQPPPELARMERAFSFLEGPARTRQRRLATPDREGPGWRVRSGVFESAPYRLRLEPPPGWRLVVGAELEQMGEDAEVGLQHEELECYLMVVPEVFLGSDASALQSALREQIAAEPAGDAVFEVFGSSVRFDRYVRDIGFDIELLQGLLRRDATVYNFVAWHPVSVGSPGREAIARGLAGVRLLDDDASRSLAAELRSSATAETAVGPAYGMRGGCYRNFSVGFTFVKPPGYWRVRAGEEARLVNESADLSIEDPESGLFALVILDPEVEMEEEDYHRSVVLSVWDEEPPAPGSMKEIVEVQGAALARSTAAAVGYDGLAPWYRVTSLIHRGTGIQVHAFGHLANRVLLEGASEALLAGLAFPAERPVATRRSSAAYEDRRLGFRFNTQGTGWRLRDETPDRLAATQAMVLGSGRDATLLVMGMHLEAEVLDEGFYVDIVRAAIGHALEEPTVSAPSVGTFDGHWAMRFEVSALDFQGRALIVRRGRLVYFLYHGGADEEDADPELERRLELLP